jgi:endoglucanase
MADEEIQGRRVLLVPLCAADADELVGLLDDPVVRGFLGVAELGGLRHRFAGWERRRSPGGWEGWLNWVVRDRGDRRALGWAQATVEKRTASVAYALLPRERGRGAASDALRAITAWLRTAGGAGDVTASIAPANLASQRVARAAGFVPGDRTREGERVWVRPRLGRGISFGGALDGDRAGDADWLAAPHFAAVRQAGFDTVRLPVKWSAHQDATAPHALDAAFLARVDRAVEAALSHDLDVVLDAHHFDAAAAGARGRLLALWTQIAERYAAVDGRLCFELLNEPHVPMTADAWNALLAEALAAVRAVSPERDAIVGPVRWNTVDALPELTLPDDDHLIVTAHYYSPFRFTHQGASWVDGADGWLGTAWGSAAERARVRTDLGRAAAWARGRRQPLFLGEFGVIDRAPMADRAAWTALVRAEAERLGLSWAYWDFATDFGAFDAERSAWREALRSALLDRD